jgi:penicillin amidase
MRIVQETIRVKGSAPVQAELQFTRHGPIIYSDDSTRRAFAVRSCWLEPGTAAYFGSASYMFARNFREFQQGISRAGAPGLNYVYGDVKGNIGWIVGGVAPIRPNWDGLMPVPGDGRYEWSGFLSSDKLPRVYNPSERYFATANEMNLPTGYPYQERKLGFEWADGSRAARIGEVLRPLAKTSLEDSMRLQNDITSIPGRRLVRLLAGLDSNDSKTKAALDLLRGWDGVERADSAQAALVELWISRHLGKAFIDAVLPENAAGVIRSPDMSVLLDTLEKPDARFGRDRRERLMLGSLMSAYLEMEELQSADATKWQWGKLHHSLPSHPLSDIVHGELRAKLQPGSLPKSGGPHTPNQSGYRLTDFQQTGGPSFRMVLDVGSWDNSRAVNYPGQSGNPDDPHYRDLTRMWLNGEYFPLLYTREAVEKATETRIVLTPKRP